MAGIINRTAIPSNANKRLFNAGSELQDEMNEDMYSTFFREYDPALGRLVAIDPLVDKYMSWTPYNFAFNDPVNLNDPTGAEAERKEYPPGYNHGHLNTLMPIIDFNMSVPCRTVT